MTPKIGEKIRFLEPKYLGYGYKLREKWNNSERYLFLSFKNAQNAFEKPELFRRKNGRNCTGIAKSLRNSQAFVPGI